jgi:hypothetical protein
VFLPFHGAGFRSRELGDIGVLKGHRCWPRTVGQGLRHHELSDLGAYGHRQSEADLFIQGEFGKTFTKRQIVVSNNLCRR